RAGSRAAVACCAARIHAGGRRRPRRRYGSSAHSARQANSAVEPVFTSARKSARTTRPNNVLPRSHTMILRVDRLQTQLPPPSDPDPVDAAAVEKLLGGKFGEMSTF